jgi:hypothetical protein
LEVATHANAASVSSPLGDDPGRHRGQLDALIATRTGVFDALMLNDADLLRNDVQLFADLDADFHQGFAIVRTNPFRLRQLMANDLARQ